MQHPNDVVGMVDRPSRVFTGDDRVEVCEIEFGEVAVRPQQVRQNILFARDFSSSAAWPDSRKLATSASQRRSAPPVRYGTGLGATTAIFMGSRRRVGFPQAAGVYGRFLVLRSTMAHDRQIRTCAQLNPARIRVQMQLSELSSDWELNYLQFEIQFDPNKN